MSSPRRFLCLSLLLALIVLLALPGLTYARELLCRSDPVVNLSNGAVINIGSSIGASKQQVTQVHYELHVPVGVTITKTVHTDGWLKSAETFTFVADQQPNQYEVITTVYTSLGTASVTANTTVKGKGKGNSPTYSTSGADGDILVVQFTI